MWTVFFVLFCFSKSHNWLYFPSVTHEVPKMLQEFYMFIAEVCDSSSLKSWNGEFNWKENLRQVFQLSHSHFLTSELFDRTASQLFCSGNDMWESEWMNALNSIWVALHHYIWRLHCDVWLAVVNRWDNSSKKSYAGSAKCTVLYYIKF